MEVKKRAPNILRVAGTSVRVSDVTIRSKQGYLKKGLTASVIGAEEDEEEAKEKANSPFERNRIARKQMRGRVVQNQINFLKNIKKDNKNVLGNLEKEKSGNNNSSSRSSSVYQTFKIKSVLQFPIEAKGEKQSLAANQKNTGKKVAKKAGKAAATAAKRTTTAATTAATGVATGGTSVVAVATAKMAVGAIKKTKEVLRAAVTKEEEKQSGKSSAGIIGALAAGAVGCLIPLVMTLVLLLPIVFIGSVFQLEQLNGATRIVTVARGELGNSEQDVGGQKYKDWYGMDDDWCAMFVSWCADQCGYINSGIMPKTASVDTMKKWYEDKNLYHTKDGYEPKVGDIIFFGNGSSHVGIVSEYNAEEGIVTTIEGNIGRSVTSPYHQGSKVSQNFYPTTYKQIVGYATPEYPLMTIEIPEPYGTEYSYMGWQMITAKNSLQYKLREEAGMNFDEDGFGKINDRYVIACTTTFGQVGDYIDWELDNGTVIKTVIGDIKNQNDEGCNEWGHRNGLCVVEFVVDKESWYGKGKYPTDFHSEWDGRVVQATKVGSFW